MQKTISLTLALVVAMQLVPASCAADTVASQIGAMSRGTRVELRLKNNERITGATGLVSTSGFALVDAHAGERQIAFDDVVSVKVAKAHHARNVWIIVGIVLVALGIIGAHV